MLERHTRLHPLGSSSVWSSNCTAKRLLLSCTWAALGLQPLPWGGQSTTSLVPPLDSCRVLLCSSLWVSGFLRHSKATRRCEGQQQATVRGCRFSARAAVTSGATSIPGPQDNATDPSHIRDTTATWLGKRRWDQHRPPLRLTPNNMLGTKCTRSSPASKFSAGKVSQAATPPYIFLIFLDNNCSHPSFWWTHKHTHTICTQFGTEELYRDTGAMVPHIQQLPKEKSFDFLLNLQRLSLFCSLYFESEKK